jgi:hypothetical protein
MQHDRAATDNRDDWHGAMALKAGYTFNKLIINKPTLISRYGFCQPNAASHFNFI